jgi:hypothetical protein
MSLFPSFPVGPVWRKIPIPEPSFTHPQWSTPGSPHSAVSERCSTSRAPFIHLSKSLVNEPSPRFPSRAPIERDAHLQSLFYITFILLSKSPIHEPPSRFPNRAPMDTDARHQSLPLRNLLQGSQSKDEPGLHSDAKVHFCNHVQCILA